MGKLRYNVAVSLDGFIARRDGSYDWILHDDSIDFTALFAEFDAFILGRRTLETMQAQGDQNPLRGRAKERVAVMSADVASSAAEEYAHVTVLRSTGEALNWIREAKTRWTGDVWLLGGGTMCGCLLAEKAVDTVETAIMPVILGDGVKMVQPPGAAEAERISSGWSLRLTGSEALKSGILMCKYDVVYPR